MREPRQRHGSRGPSGTRAVVGRNDVDRDRLAHTRGSFDGTPARAARLGATLSEGEYRRRVVCPGLTLERIDLPFLAQAAGNRVGLSTNLQSPNEFLIAKVSRN